MLVYCGKCLDGEDLRPNSAIESVRLVEGHAGGSRWSPRSRFPEEQQYGSTGKPVTAFECPLLGIQVVPRKDFRPEKISQGVFYVPS